jgi:hypothetical protein
MMEQQLRIKDFKHWPFPVLFGVSIDGKYSTLSQFDAVNTQKCRIKYTKQPKCKLYDTVADIEDALF